VPGKILKRFSIVVAHVFSAFLNVRNFDLILFYLIDSRSIDQPILFLRFFKTGGTPSPTGMECLSNDSISCDDVMNKSGRQILKAPT